ncbi:GGDEF domain-containing protein [Deinococcus caeni]|uniref:GGDEF domain-containing protein n=1 Tax=Deinococcus caeni TaxID=569127 RepID=UPI00362410B1
MNDTWGHQLGDTVLQHTAQLIRGVARPGDVTARYGGEEFMILRPDASSADLALTCQELQRRMHAHPWQDIIPDLRVTLSIGVADTARADPGLRRAGRRGRPPPVRREERRPRPHPRRSLNVTSSPPLTAPHADLIRIPFVSPTIRNFTGLPAPRPEPVSLPLASARIERSLQPIQSETV